MPSEIVTKCSSVLIEKKLTLAFAESATAGMACAEFALTEDAGKFLKGGLVCYDACIKQDMLKVPEALVDQFTPESAEVTEAAAKGLTSFIPADIHIAITGLTTSGGSETEEKPVGTMFLHCFYQGKGFARRYVFEGNPEEIVMQTVDKVAFFILDTIKA